MFLSFHIGIRLRQLRLALNLSQEALGVSVGLEVGSASARISRYESGDHEPPYSFSCRVAELFQVPVCWIYCEDDELSRLILTASNCEKLIQKLNTLEIK